MTMQLQNRTAAGENLSTKQIKIKKYLEIISGATYLFEEPGTLERAVASARLWFERYLNKDQADVTAKNSTKRG